MSATKEISANVRLQVKGGQASPAPPIGPKMGAAGVNIMEFCKKFNAATQDKAGQLLRVYVTVYKDKTFDMVVKSPSAVVQIMETAKLKSGSSESNRTKVGTITWDQVRKIAEEKLEDLNCFSVDAAMKTIAGTARSMGVKVEGGTPPEGA